MNHWNLLPKEETFTELYFENHTHLPEKIEPDKKYSFKFTVHNLENKDFNYIYTITNESSKSATILKKGEFRIKNDAYKTITEYFTLPEPIERSKIAVNLINKHQTIHFWTDTVVQ